MFRTCGIILLLVINVYCEQEKRSEPWITSLKVSDKRCVENNCKYLLSVRGREFLGHYSWRLSPKEGARGSECAVFESNYELREIKTEEAVTNFELSVPDVDGKIYFCLQHHERKNTPFGGEWVHQGPKLFLDPKNDFIHLELSSDTVATTKNPKKGRSNLEDLNPNWSDLSHDTDVNNLPNAARPTRDERKDIEVRVNNKYVPLDDTEAQYSKGSNRKGTGTQYVNNENKFRDLENNFKYNVNVNGKSNNANTDLLSNQLSRKKRFLNDIENVIYVDDLFRSKRETRNRTDDLITKEDILNAKVDLENSVRRKPSDENHDDALIKMRKQRQTSEFLPKDGVVRVKGDPFPVIVEGLRVEDSDKEPKIIEESIPSVLADSKVTLRLFGQGYTNTTVIAFTYDPLPAGQPCKFLVKGEYLVIPESLTPRTAVFQVRAPKVNANESKFYICAKNLQPGITDPFNDEGKYTHQGVESYKVLASHDKLMPLWVAIILVLICLTFSALFSGLNLGLMSLDRTELKIISNTGTEQERKYARAIMPVRDHGNYLLCSILLGNVAVNSTFTILLDDLTSGLFAVIFSTLAIVLLGEITPQAICSRHGLMVGAKSIMVTKAVMALTAPLAYPVSKILDYLLGEEIGSVYNRERLKELVKVTTDVNDLDKDEVNIISGALELRKKTVADVMTKLEDVFMLPITSILDFETMSEIIKSGYSRIPVYEGHRGNIVTVLFIKDLAFVDPDDNTALRTLCQYYQNQPNFVFEDVTLDVMFKQFKEGHKGHMAFVHRINNEGEGDPFYETIGLVTLEDVIEEMIQAEIVDETDVFLDNRTKKRRNKPTNKLQDFTAFAERHEHRRIHISPQLTLAAFQFLSTSVDAFRPELVSETVLRRLLKQDVIQHIKLKGKTKKDPSTYVFHQGKPVDYFVLILEGRVEVTVGRENLVFEAGPFTYFGVQALTQNIGIAESPTPSAVGSLQNINMDAALRHTFVPDYSVRATTELYYLTVKRSLYLAAKRATLMEKGALSKGATNEQFDTEVDKYFSSDSGSPHEWPTQSMSTKSLGVTGKHVCDKSSDTDANSCVECVRNKFWMNACVLNKSSDDVDREADHNHKKKKTTFHADSSLLTFHDLSPNDLDLVAKSSNDPEYEKRTLDYDRDWRDREREKDRERKVELEQRVLNQLSKILWILEGKNQT